MTHYRNGKAREYKVRDELVANGWVLLAQSGGSKGAADLVMTHPRHGQPIRYWVVDRGKPSQWREWTHDPQWHCDECQEGFWGDPPDPCWHGVTVCEDCRWCPDCATEERRP
jgi:hypothetical protein